MTDRFIKLEKRIGYSFKNKVILQEALTHSSKGYISDDGKKVDNERLEFVGDAMLDAIIGASLYDRLPEAREGELSKLRAQIVCEASLAEVGNSLSIGEELILGQGEEKTLGRNKNSVIADAMEAIIGGIYLDGGYSEANIFVKRVFSEMIDMAIEGKLFRDYKTRLQELAQSKGWNIAYICDEARGPDHDKTFFVHLEVNGKKVGAGTGRSKKEAEQNAARDFMRNV